MTAAPARLLRTLASDLGKAHLPAKIGDLALSLVSVALFSRLFAAADYALYTLTWAALTTLHALGVSWVHLTGLRYWRDPSTTPSTSPDAEDRIVSALDVSLLGALAVTLVLWFTGQDLLLPEVGGESLWVGAALLCVFSLNQQTITRARAMRELNLFVVLSLLPRPFALAFGLFAVWQGHLQPNALLWALAGGYGVSVLVEMALNGRRYWPQRFKLQRSDVTILLGYGAPVALTALSNMVLTVSDRFLIAHFHGTQAAGEYTLANSLIGKADSLTMFVGAAAFPLLVDRFEAHGPEQTARDLSRLITTFCTAYLPLTVGLALVAQPVCDVLIGSKYPSAPGTMLALAPAVFGLGMLRYLVRPFQIAARPVPQLVLTAAGGLLTVGLNLMLIPRLGPLGAAWGTAAGAALCCIGHYYWAQRVLPYSLEWRELGKIALATSGMAIATSLALTPKLPSLLSLALACTTGAIAYALLTLSLNIANARQHLQRLLARTRS
jgi:O-antigen/teichoic acid export membrane protein